VSLSVNSLNYDIFNANMTCLRCICLDNLTNQYTVSVFIMTTWHDGDNTTSHKYVINMT